MTSVAPRIANDVSCVTPINHESHFFRGRRNIWGCWRMTSVAPRIVNDVSCVTSINRESFFVAGAMFGDVGGWLLLLRAL